MRQIYEYHPVVGFRFVPGISSRVQHESGGYLVKTNATGFRCPHEFQPARTPGQKRILLFGDSFTAGEGVSNGYRYGDFLETLIPDLEVYNFGLPATGPDQHHLIYKEFARDIEHDLLVIAVFVENIRRVASRYRYFRDDAGRTVLYAKPYYTLDDGKLTLHGVPPPKQPIDESELPESARGSIAKTARFPRLKKTFSTLSKKNWFRAAVVDSGLKEKLQRLSGYQPIPEYKNEKGSAWQTMRAILIGWIKSNAKPAMIVPIPMYQYVAGLSDPSYYQARLREAAVTAGARYFDPLPDLMRPARDVRRGFYFEHDNHLTREGHEAVARSLAPAIQDALGATR